MNPLRRYGPVDNEVRTAAVAAARELINAGWSRTSAAREVASGIAVHPNTVSNWLRDSEPTMPGSTVPDLQAQVRRLQDMLEVSHTMMRKLVDERHGLGDRFAL